MTGAGSPTWRDWVDEACAEVVAGGRWRAPRSFDARGHEGLLTDRPAPVPARPVVSFASNDYLGLATHPAVVAGAARALERWGAGSGASRLVTGSRPVHHELEGALAAWKGTEAAVVLPTGFAANLARRVHSILRLQRCADLRNRHPKLRQLIRLHPDAQRILSRPKHLDARHALHASHCVDKIDVRVVREERAIIR